MCRKMIDIFQKDDFRTLFTAFYYFQNMKEYACKTYEHLYKDDPRNDLTSDDFKKKCSDLDYDVLLAGFPCQTFSRAGKKAGFEDTIKGTISHLFRCIRRFLFHG